MVDRIYDNTNSLQVEFFKFYPFPFIQQKLNDINIFWNNHSICQSAQSDRNLHQQVNQMFFISLRETPINTYSNVLLVGE